MDLDKDDMAKGLPTLEFQELKDRIGFTTPPVLTSHLLLDRPCGDGAVPPYLLDDWDNADQTTKASIAHRYSNGGYGIDAYIIQLRMQIAYGATLEGGLYKRTRATLDNGQPTASAQIWELAHHQFGQDPDADVKVKGCILYLLHGKQAVMQIPRNTMDGLQELAAGIAYPLMFDRHETTLLRPRTLYRKSVTTDDRAWHKVNLPAEGLPIVHYWDGTNDLEEQLDPLLKKNLAWRFPELTDPPLSGLILPFFNKPILIPVRYECSKELLRGPAFPHMLSLKLSGRTVDFETDGEGPSTKLEEPYYHLCAIVNLDTDDVRLYGPDAAPTAEYSPPSGNAAGQRRDNGRWSVSQRDTKFLLWYHLRTQ